MKNSDSHRLRPSGSRRSSSLALDPYFIEDIAMTAGELERGRSSHIWVIEPR
jgi:hypothetical protein